MRNLLSIFFALSVLASPAAAQDRRDELASALDSGQFPGLVLFLDLAGGRRGAAAADFALASPDNSEERAAELRDFDRLLRGGKYDKTGEHIRRELAKLPGAQWRFVIKLERERRALYKRLGWGPGGNIYQGACGWALNMEPRRCYERRENLTKTMAPLQAQSAFSAWRTEDLVANMITVSDSRGLRDELYGGVHEAPCFVYTAGGTRVELVADAWANSLTPAYTWWYQFDKATHDYMYKAGGSDWCSQQSQRNAEQAQKQARHAPAAPPKSSTLESVLGASPF
ncbi:MAG: hypothetical protein NDI60_01850 [Elusimicrobiales bacterium]|nr:hypothetical protein [Elusimicrobiales bacterium]